MWVVQCQLDFEHFGKGEHPRVVVYLVESTYRNIGMNMCIVTQAAHLAMTLSFRTDQTKKTSLTGSRTTQLDA